MRQTDFWARMNRRFGAAYAESFARDMVIAPLGGRTVVEALGAGTDVKEVWRAVCEVVEVAPTDR